jgi:hypothetical protein
MIKILISYLVGDPFHDIMFRHYKIIDKVGKKYNNKVYKY